VDNTAVTYREKLLEVSKANTDYSCPLNLSPELAEILYQTAERIISREDEHVSPAALEVILPLLKLAAHSGSVAAQHRYGYYVIGYYATDEMFWPHDKETAADALAMLRVLAVDNPDVVGDSRSWILGGYEPTSDQKPFAQAWVNRAKKIEAQYRKCHVTSPQAK
jgi:hypothetical protein